MNREQQLTLFINQGLQPEKPIITPASGIIHFNPPPNSTKTISSSFQLIFEIPKESVSPIAQKALMILITKTLNPNIHGPLAPAFLYELLHDDHLRSKVTETETAIQVEFSSNGSLEKAVSYFLTNLIGKNEFQINSTQQINFWLKSNTLIDSALKSYCENQYFDDLGSFLLHNSELGIKSTVNIELASLLDSLISVLSAEKVFPFFSFSQECSVQMDLDYVGVSEQMNYWNLHKTNASLFFGHVTAFLSKILEFFQELREENNKTWAKLFDFLGGEILREIPVLVSLEFANFCNLKAELKINGFFQLAEFLLHHPVLKDKQSVRKYKENYLLRFRDKEESMNGG